MGNLKKWNKNKSIFSLYNPPVKKGTDYGILQSTLVIL